MVGVGPASTWPCASCTTGTARRGHPRASHPPAFPDDGRPSDRLNGAPPARSRGTSRHAGDGELRPRLVDDHGRAARCASSAPSDVAYGPRSTGEHHTASRAASDHTPAPSTPAASRDSSDWPTERGHDGARRRERSVEVEADRPTQGRSRTGTQSTLPHRRIHPERQNPHTIRA